MNQESTTSNKNNMTNTELFPSWLSHFITVYEQLSTDNIELIHTVYDKNITFQDPIHEIEGITSLHQYFTGLYTNLTYCHFKIKHVIHNNHEASVYWDMSYQHKSLNKGNEVTISGSSWLNSKNGKIITHRDYLDLGAMLYEQIPVIGKLIVWIKKRAAK